MLQAEDIDQCFEKLPRSLMGLTLATYVYSLHIHNYLRPDITNQPAKVYLCCPVSVIEQVLSHVKNGNDSDWPTEVQALLPFLKKYYNQMTDYAQGQTLQKLGRGMSLKESR